MEEEIETNNNLSSGPTHVMYTPTILAAWIILEFILLFNVLVYKFHSIYQFVFMKINIFI